MGSVVGHGLRYIEIARVSVESQRRRRYRVLLMLMLVAVRLLMLRRLSVMKVMLVI